MLINAEEKLGRKRPSPRMVPYHTWALHKSGGGVRRTRLREKSHLAGMNTPALAFFR